MNKDKAIQLLERLQDPEPYEPMLTKDAYDAIQMAIDALSADGDTISRKAAIETINRELRCGAVIDQCGLETAHDLIEELPPAQPEQLGTNLAEVSTDVPDINVGDINKFIDSLEEIFADIRERHVDDSVCGLCEYDGAYIGQSGDWCNECPGFDRDDCFKLSDKCRKRWIDTITKALPSAQPEQHTCVNCGRTVNNGGWYADGRTRCPIEEHYALPKDGYCHLWEKRNVADDDYPERRTDGEIIPE